MISVVIPVGPYKSNQRWLQECVNSVLDQTVQPTIVFVDDMAGLDPAGMLPVGYPHIHWKSPWYLGVAHAFNIGVAVAPDELVFMLGSDDTLEARCLDRCIEEYMRTRDDLAYYYVKVRYMDSGLVQDTACNAAMVTKSLWRLTGGFPIQSASGAPDAALLSIMLGNYPHAGRIRSVQSEGHLYNYRTHANSDTAKKSKWQNVILETRDLVTREWRPYDA